MSLAGGLSHPWGERLRTWREEIKGWSREEFIDEVTAVAFRTKEPRGPDPDLLATYAMTDPAQEQWWRTRLGRVHADLARATDLSG